MTASSCGRRPPSLKSLSLNSHRAFKTLQRMGWARNAGHPLYFEQFIFFFCYPTLQVVLAHLFGRPVKQLKRDVFSRRVNSVDCVNNRLLPFWFTEFEKCPCECGKSADRCCADEVKRQHDIWRRDGKLDESLSVLHCFQFKSKMFGSFFRKQVKQQQWKSQGHINLHSNSTLFA